MSAKKPLDDVGLDYLHFNEMQKHIHEIVGHFDPFDFIHAKSNDELQDIALLRRTEDGLISGYGHFMIFEEIFKSRQRFSRVLTALHGIMPAYYALDIRPAFKNGVVSSSILIKRAKIEVTLLYSKCVDDFDPENIEVTDLVTIGMTDAYGPPLKPIREDKDFAIF